MPLPPLRLTIDALLQDVLPAAGGGAFIVCLFLAFGRRTAALGSAIAIVFAFIWANFVLEKESIDQETGKVLWLTTHRLIHWKGEPDSPGWHRIPIAAVLLTIVGLVSRWIGLLVSRYLPERRWWWANLLVWVPRITAVVVASGWMLTEKDAEAFPQLRITILLAMLLIWIVLDGVARSRESGEVAAYLAMIFYAAGVVLLFGQSSRLL